MQLMIDLLMKLVLLGSYALAVSPHSRRSVLVIGLYWGSLWLLAHLYADFWVIGHQMRI